MSVDPTEYTEEELADMTPEELDSSQPKQKRKTSIFGPMMSILKSPLTAMAKVFNAVQKIKPQRLLENVPKEDNDTPLPSPKNPAPAPAPMPTPDIPEQPTPPGIPPLPNLNPRMEGYFRGIGQTQLMGLNEAAASMLT